jgi:hypothetical protein
MARYQTQRIDGNKLRSLDTIPFEEWLEHGVSLRAVSANGDGRVNSGILRNGQYFYRVWEPKKWWLSGITPTSRLLLESEDPSAR